MPINLFKMQKYLIIQNFNVQAFVFTLLNPFMTEANII